MFTAQTNCCSICYHIWCDSCTSPRCEPGIVNIGPCEPDADIRSAACAHDEAESRIHPAPYNATAMPLMMPSMKMHKILSM
jgi:hypothetical protein